jgi:hypothetical protein
MPAASSMQTSVCLGTTIPPQLNPKIDDLQKIIIIKAAFGNKLCMTNEWIPNCRC